jgi:hypothetical protein
MKSGDRRDRRPMITILRRRDIKDEGLRVALEDFTMDYVKVHELAFIEAHMVIVMREDEGRVKVLYEQSESDVESWPNKIYPRTPAIMHALTSLGTPYADDVAKAEAEAAETQHNDESVGGHGPGYD